MELIKYFKLAISWWASRELQTQLKLAIPITLTLALQQLPVFLSLLFVGWIRVEEEEESSLNLNAAALGTSIFNITATSAFTGLSSAADTLISQTYGFGNYKRVGVIFQRGLLISLLTTLFIICLLLNTESLLLLCQQDPCVARLAAVYVRILIFAYPFFALYIMLQKFLQAQSIVWPFILTGLLTNVINVSAHSLFIFGLGLGVEGAATALVISMAFQPLLLILYIKIRKLHKKTWTGWGVASLEEWPEYLKLAIPGTIMISAEWTGYEIIQIVLGVVSTVELAVSGILSSYVIFVFMIPYSFSIALSIRVGNELGKGNVLQTKRAIRVALVVMGFVTVAVLSVTFGLRTHFGELYNANEEIAKKLNYAVYAVCAQLLGDQVQGFLSGIVRGAGHQLQGAIVNQVAYYVIGLPIGIGIGVGLDMGALGVWIGLAIAANIQAVCIGVILLRLNWDKEAELAMKRGAGHNDYHSQCKMNSGNAESTDIELKIYAKDGLSIEGGATTSGNDMIVISDKDQQETDLDNNLQDTINTGDEANLIANNNTDIITDGDNLDSDIADKHTSSSIVALKKKLASHSKLLLIHSLMVTLAIVCLIFSGLTSLLHFPDSLTRSSNYTLCVNITG